MVSYCRNAICVNIECKCEEKAELSAEIRKVEVEDKKVQNAIISMIWHFTLFISTLTTNEVNTAKPDTAMTTIKIIHHLTESEI